VLLQSQQDLSLADLDDSCGTREEQNKKSRFTRRLGSPDRAVWETAGGGVKNEIEKMFEKFKIKMAAEEEDAVSSMTVCKSTMSDGITESDFSPTHSEHSKLISNVNKAYSSSADDIAHTATITETKPDGEKTGKKKHKHKKDKRDKDKKRRHSKSKSKHEPAQDSVAGTAAESQTIQQATMLKSDDSVLVTASVHTSDNDLHTSFSQSLIAQVAESTELVLPSVHTSCHTNIVFSEIPGTSNTDDAGSVDWNPLDFSTSELLPQAPTTEVCLVVLSLVTLV